MGRKVKTMKSTEIFGAAKWMSPGETQVPLIRGVFSAENVKSAEIVICGLGMFELHINGKAVDDDLYGTLCSDFEPSLKEHCQSVFGEKLAHRIYAKKLDITELIESENCVGIILAPGWYRCGGLYGLSHDYGDDKLCFRIKLTREDGSVSEILSGDFLKWHESPVVSWNFFTGEHHDYNDVRVDGWDKIGYDASDWKPLHEVSAPESEFMFSDCPPDRIIRYIRPKLLSETESEFIYDMGENITGTPILRQRGTGSVKLTFRVSERLNPDGSIEDYTNHAQNSSFVTDGSDRTYRLRFSWNGFRYCAVSKNAEAVSCAVIHSDVPVTSSFRSSDSLLEWMYSAYVRTQLDNMHCGIPSDCPHIEKRGYTGDGELVCECAMLMLGAREFYKKWLGDISDCQDRISGHVQYTAPYVHSGGGPGGWGCAIAEVPYQYYRMYGEREVLEEFLPKVLHYFDYLEAHSENGLVVSDQKGDWCLGDWCTPEKIAIPEPYVNTYFFVKTIGRAVEFCEVLGRGDLIPGLKKLADEKKAAITAKYFGAETGDFAKNIQGANAFAVDIGIGDERTFANMVAHYEKNKWYDTGIFGTDIVTRVLFERGYETLAYELLVSKERYSFHHWRSTGSTTFPEYWTYNRSQNHPMFGAVVKYLFTFILGITEEGAGWKNIVIRPRIPEGLDSAEGHITVPGGVVSVRFVKLDGHTCFRITVPDGAAARLEYNGSRELHAGVNEIVL